MELYSRSRRGALETGPQPLTEGGEGLIYAPPSEPGTIVKVFKDATAQPRMVQERLAERAGKLEELVRHPPYNPPAPDGHRRFAWPCELLFDGAGQFAGYAMPLVPGGLPLERFINPKGSQFREPRFRVGLARAVAEVVAEVHHHELLIVLGDVSDTNFLADAKGRVALIDIDSVQIRSRRDGRIYLCPARSNEYTPPELMGRDLATTLGTQEHDLFGLAVLIYQLLFAGWHPFAVCDERSLEARIQAGDCRQIVGGDGVPPDAPPFGGSSDVDVGDVLRSLFVRAFVAGHADPRLRPTAEEWVEALLRYEKFLGRRVASVPGPAPQVAPQVAPAAAPPRRRRAVVAVGGVAALAASVLFGLGRPIGDADVKGRVSPASVERRQKAVTDDGGSLPRGPEHSSETPLYWRHLLNRSAEPFSFEAPSASSWEGQR